MGSPFKITASQLSGLSPLKQEGEQRWFDELKEAVDAIKKKYQIEEIQEDHEAMTDYWNETITARDDPNSLLNRRLRGDFLGTENIIRPKAYSSGELTDWDTELGDWYTGDRYEDYDINAIKEKVRANLKNLGIDNIADADPWVEKEWNWLNDLAKREQKFRNWGDIIRAKKIFQVGMPEGSHMHHNKGAIDAADQMTLSPGQAEYLKTDLLDIYGHELGHGTLGTNYNLSERDKVIIQELQQIDRKGFDDDKYTWHHEDAGENYSDLQAIRLDMLRSGLYDWRKEQLTSEVWNEYLDTYKDKDKPLPLRRLIETFRISDTDMGDIKKEQKDAEKDQNIIFINNAIAGVEEKDENSPLAMRVDKRTGF
tara:strand:+ start:51 stop:1154 length:1104 start_codon:yes stop_codon:yes gene_type:complete